jgi:hypothetical protein
VNWFRLIALGGHKCFNHFWSMSLPGGSALCDAVATVRQCVTRLTTRFATIRGAGYMLVRSKP